MSMTEDQRKKCHKIIHTASVSGAAIAAGMAQLPGADASALLGIEIAMVISLGAVFGSNVTKATAKAFVLSSAAAYAGRGISQALVGWIPGVGNAINATTAATLIEAVGWAAAKDFERKAFKVN